MKDLTVQTYINLLATRFEEADLFYGHGTDNALDDAFYLVFGALDIDFLNTDTHGEALARDLSHADLNKLESLALQRIEEKVPVAYLLGEAWFAGHRFYCDERALIPRSPIAELIANRFEPLLAKNPTRILDLCTGGGCIGIACALEFTSSQVDLVDNSSEALALAQKNCDFHGLSERVALIESDLYEQITGAYDLIVANPPYVAKDEVESLPDEYRHEPESGLISADRGLALPLNILREAADYLHPDGLLIMEVGYSHNLLAERLRDVPLLWLEFEHGGEGVCALSAQQIREFRARFI